jgi:hypothetical protein
MSSKKTGKAKSGAKTTSGQNTVNTASVQGQWKAMVDSIHTATQNLSPTKEREGEIWQNSSEVEDDEKAWQLTFDVAPDEKVKALVEKVREDIRDGKIKPLDFTKK